MQVHTHCTTSKLASHSRMHEYVRHQRNKVHPHTDALQLQDPSVLRTRIFPQNHFASDLLPRHFINSAHLAAGMDSCTSTPTWRSHTEPEACSPARRLTSICTHANSYVPCHKLASAPRCVDEKTRVTVPCTTCATPLHRQPPQLGCRWSGTTTLHRQPPQLGCRWSGATPLHRQPPQLGCRQSGATPHHRQHLSLAAGVAAATPIDRKSTRLNSSHSKQSRMPSSA